jgi:hypothetical protein
MVGLVPTNHVFFGGSEAFGMQKKSWMVATSATMTVEETRGQVADNGTRRLNSA